MASTAAQRRQALVELRRQRLAAAVHRLGPRALAELLAELGRAHGIVADIDARLARYARLAPAVLAVVGGDRFPPAPLWSVGGGR